MFSRRVKGTTPAACALRFAGALAILLMGPVNGDESLDPVTLLQQIKAKGAETVYKNYLTGNKWLALLKNVETGKKPWLEVAVAIYPATDGGPAEDLTLAAGSALTRSPREVLLLVAPKLGMDGICSYSEMTMGYRKLETRQQVTADIDARISAVRKLTGADIATPRDQCLKTLETSKRELLSSEGLFSAK